MAFAVWHFLPRQWAVFLEARLSGTNLRRSPAVSFAQFWGSEGSFHRLSIGSVATWVATWYSWWADLSRLQLETHCLVWVSNLDHWLSRGRSVPQRQAWLSPFPSVPFQDLLTRWAKKDKRNQCSLRPQRSHKKNRHQKNPTTQPTCLHQGIRLPSAAVPQKDDGWDANSFDVSTASPLHLSLSWYNKLKFIWISSNLISSHFRGQTWGFHVTVRFWYFWGHFLPQGAVVSQSIWGHQCSDLFPWVSVGPGIREVCLQAIMQRPRTLSVVSRWTMRTERVGLWRSCESSLGMISREHAFGCFCHGLAIPAPNREPMAVPVCRRPEHDVAHWPLRKVPNTVWTRCRFLVRGFKIGA